MDTSFANQLPRSGLKKIFDDQIYKIQAMIDQELQKLEHKNDSNVQVVSISLVVDVLKTD